MRGKRKKKKKRKKEMMGAGRFRGGKVIMSDTRQYPPLPYRAEIHSARKLKTVIQRRAR
jgi:hypothetical protein